MEDSGARSNSRPRVELSRLAELHGRLVARALTNPRQPRSTPPNIKVAHEWYDLDGDTNLDDITAIPKTAFEDLKDAPVYSNALDLARFCQGLFHDRALVSDKSLAAMLDFRPVHDPAEPIAAECGLGVGVFHLPNLDGLEHYGHGGNGFGYIAMMLYLPQHKASVVLLVNDGATMAVAEPFLQAVDKGL